MTGCFSILFPHVDRWGMLAEGSIAGIRVLPEALISRACLGIATTPFFPTTWILPSAISTTAFSIGALPVPSIPRAPINTTVWALACALAQTGTRTSTKSVVTNRCMFRPDHAETDPSRRVNRQGSIILAGVSVFMFRSGNNIQLTVSECHGPVGLSRLGGEP